MLALGGPAVISPQRYCRRPGRVFVRGNYFSRHQKSCHMLLRLQLGTLNGTPCVCEQQPSASSFFTRELAGTLPSWLKSKETLLSQWTKATMQISPSIVSTVNSLCRLFSFSSFGPRHKQKLAFCRCLCGRHSIVYLMPCLSSRFKHFSG